MSYDSHQWFDSLIEWGKSLLQLKPDMIEQNPDISSGETKEERKRLIISSGDISDVDGFFALAAYAKTGSDVLFVMNYPAYVSEIMNDKNYESDHPGKGYKYSAREVLSKTSEPPPEYSEFMKKYGIPESVDPESTTTESVNLAVKSAMTDMAHQLASRVWSGESAKGELLYCIGGVNSINPFSSSAVKNEMLVFAGLLPRDLSTKNPSADLCNELDALGHVYDKTGERISLDLTKYDDVYLDFNGSMAFFGDDHWLCKQLKSEPIPEKVRGAFVMGGVQASETPKTMPSIKGTLNRFSCATMNQLYHPRNTHNFFEYVSRNKIPVFTVTNNVVHDLSTWADEEHTHKTYQGVEDFLLYNNLDRSFLRSLADTYYNNKHGSPPPRKAFDFYVAFALCKFIDSKHRLPSCHRYLFYSEEYGVTLVSKSSKWHDTLESYSSHIDQEENKSDSPFIAAKKASFRTELSKLEKLASAPLVMGVNDLHFGLDQNTHTLSLHHEERVLVVSSGDISDVDGFFALAEYSKSGVDTLFVMNYPAYVGIPSQEVVDDAKYEKEQQGLGYKYSASEVLAKLEKAQGPYKDFMDQYADLESNANLQVKCAMTDLAHHIARRVWQESVDVHHRGRLFFCIGGVNQVNPFSRSAIKNEMLVFAEFAPPKGTPKLDPVEGAVYDENGELLEGGLDLGGYDNVYMDFNGSMAFLGEESKLYMALQSAAEEDRLCGLFAMGGVQADEPPRTMPRIEGTLNRLSCATMNQLYHPVNTGRLFALTSKFNVPTYLVSNNVVSDLTTWEDEEHKKKSYVGVRRFLEGHGLNGAFLTGLAQAYYDGGHGQPPRKVFDYYTAVVLRAVMAGAAQAVPSTLKTLYYSTTHGVSLVARQPCGGWDEARNRYKQQISSVTTTSSRDSDFVAKKKRNLIAEAKLLDQLAPAQAVEVKDVAASINGLMRLSTTRSALGAGKKAILAVVRLQRAGKFGLPSPASSSSSSTSTPSLSSPVARASWPSPK